MNEPPPNNHANTLAKLLRQVDLPTLLAVFLMGGGNWVATKEDGRLTREESERVAKEVHELHNSLGNQTKLLENQTKLLENQAKGLEELRRLHLEQQQ